jgi:hypothetical protein
MELMNENDLVVILADDVAGTLETVRQHSADGVK